MHLYTPAPLCRFPRRAIALHHPFWKRVLAIVAALFVAGLFLGGLRLTVMAGDSARTLPGKDSTAVNLSVFGQSSAEDDGDPAGSSEIEIIGVVLSAPGDPQGYGEWAIRSRSGHVYHLIADRDTEFKPQLPTINQTVKVKGRFRHSEQEDEILASKIEIEGDDSGDGDRKYLQGILVSVPDGGIGLWVIRTGITLTIDIIADGNTRLDDSNYEAGNWVEVRGTWQSNNSFLATRIRLEGHETSEVVVRLANGVISTTVASRYELVPKATLLSSGNIHLFSTRDDEERSIVAKLTADRDVLWAELNFVGGIPEGHGYKTWRWGGTSPGGYVNQNAFTQVNLAPVLGEVQGQGIVVAILDTGINQAHVVFAGRLLPGYDMVADDNDPEDEGDGLGWGHGTHIAGIIAQMSPKSKLLPVRVLNSNGRGDTFALAYGIEWAVEHGADVINLSLGADANSQVLKDVIEHAIEQGVIIVAAAGNMNNDVPQFPANFPGVISVTAVDSENTKADFASYGADWVDLAAPGVGITSTMVGPFGSGYASWSGTSMATGFVSGAAALARQHMPNASVAQINGRLMAHAQSLDNHNPAYAGKLGGLLDVAAALDLNNPVATTTPIPLTPTPTPTVQPTATPTPQNPGTGGQEQLFLPYVRR